MWKFSAYLFLFLCCATYADDLDIDNYQALTSDRKAYRIGEPIVILVVESTTAESSAGTGVSTQVDMEASSYTKSWEGSTGLAISGSNDGAGQTVRKGRASTQLSARIVEVLPNKMFRIAGEQHLLINGEKQTITLTGVVRALDIAKDNTILSNRIADASIEIHGDGDVSNAQRESIIFKVFSWLGIF